MPRPRQRSGHPPGPRAAGAPPGPQGHLRRCPRHRPGVAPAEVGGFRAPALPWTVPPRPAGMPKERTPSPRYWRPTRRRTASSCTAPRCSRRFPPKASRSASTGGPIASARPRPSRWSRLWRNGWTAAPRPGCWRSIGCRPRRRSPAACWRSPCRGRRATGSSGCGPPRRRAGAGRRSPPPATSAPPGSRPACAAPSCRRRSARRRSRTRPS